MFGEVRNGGAEAHPKEVKAKRLEQALQNMITAARINGLLATISDGLGKKIRLEVPRIFSNPEFIRTHLTSLKKFTDFDTQTVCVDPTNYFAESDRLSGKKTSEILEPAVAFMFPAFIAQWLTSSRRVYHIGTDLQLQLMATKIKDVKWSEIKFPFDSFGISLDIPITSQDGKKFDFMLFNIIKSDEGKSHISVTLLPESLDNLYTPSKMQLSRIKEAIDKKKFEAANRICSAEWQKQAAATISYGHLSQNLASNETVEDTIRKQGNGIIEYEYALRVGLGALLYMQQRGETDAVPVRDSYRPRGEAKGSIAALADVFALRSSRKLSQELRSVLYDAVVRNRGSRGLVASHFRSGYWHRPKGTGWDPFQPATEWTKPTIVNKVKDALPQGVQVAIEK